MEKRGLIDLHFHSGHSDGSEDIASIIKEAKMRGIIALALTDHNNGGGISEFVAACEKEGIAHFEGVEIYLLFPNEDWSTVSGTCGRAPDAVILGRSLNWEFFKKEYQEPLMRYWVDYWLPVSLAGLKSVGLEVPFLSKEEMRQQVKGCGIPPVLHDVPKNPKNWPALLKASCQYELEVTLDDIQKRPVHFANRHLYSIDRPAYVLRVFPEWSVAKAVDLAHGMGGMLFAAHPGGNGNFAQWSREHLDYFVREGGDGLEVWQYWHTPEQINLFLQYAVKDKLLVSGGSDWHGVNGRSTLGSWDKPLNQVPIWVLAHLLDVLS